MTKVQRRKERLEKHYEILEKLSEFLGKKQDGKKLSLKLWKLEQHAHKAATDGCNGDITGEQWGKVVVETEAAVEKLFDGAVPGLIINGDARGYAIKIDSEYMKQYEQIDLHRDWGGNGILSPEINGEA